MDQRQDQPKRQEDQRPAERAPTQPGGGTASTDPTFANQSKSLPKEQKPNQPADLRR